MLTVLPHGGALIGVQHLDQVWCVLQTAAAPHVYTCALMVLLFAALFAVVCYWRGVW